MIIFLSASVSTLKERICKRGRDYEMAMSNEYLEQLSQCYMNYVGFMRDQIGSQVLVVDTEGKSQFEVFDEVNRKLGFLI